MWDPESTDMESVIHSVESGIQDSLGLPYMGRSFGALPATDEGIYDLKESSNLGDFPVLDIGRPKVSKNQV